MTKNGEGRQWNASNEASLPSLFNLELMLSCVMKRSQTSRYSMRGSERVVGGVDLFVWVHSYNAPLCPDCSASYGPILAYIPSRHPLHHQICSRATETGGPGPLHIFFFQAELGLLTEKGPSGDLVVRSTFPALENTGYVPSKNEHNPPVLGAEHHIYTHTVIVAFRALQKKCHLLRWHDVQV